MSTNQTAQEQIDALNERIEGYERKEREERFSKLATEFIGDTEKHVSLLQSFARAFGEDSEEVKDYVEQQRVVARRIPAGKAAIKSGNAIAQVEVKARSLKEKNSNLSHDEALAQVFHEDPQLYQRYRDEVSVN